MRPMKIKTVDFEWECFDGCCTEWGVRLWMDETLVEATFADVGDALSYALEQLGYEVEHEYEDE